MHTTNHRKDHHNCRYKQDEQIAADGKELIKRQGIPQHNRAVETDAAREHHRCILKGNDASEQYNENELVDAICKIASYHAGNHLLALRAVEELTHQPAEQRRNWCHNDNSKHNAHNAVNMPMRNENQARLSRHRAEDNTEVHAKARDHWDNQRQNEHTVSDDSRNELLQKIAEADLGGEECTDTHNGK